MLIADDLPPYLMKMLAPLAAKGVNYVWDKFTNWTPVKNVISKFRSQLDLNDDNMNYLGN